MGSAPEAGPLSTERVIRALVFDAEPRPYTPSCLAYPAEKDLIGRSQVRGGFLGRILQPGARRPDEE